MPYRELNVYDDPFPTLDQILSGDPAAPPFPQEVWRQKISPGEFAVRYKDFKTGRARNPEGLPVQSSEICRVFESLAEARSDSRQVSNKHWTVRCMIYDHTGAQVDSVFNTRETGKFAARMSLVLLLWGGFFALAGMALIWSIYRVALLLLAPGSQPIRSLTWLGWSAFAAGGLGIAGLAWWIKLRRNAGRTINRVRASFTEDEMKRFEEINTLFGTADPVERARLLALTREYQRRIRDALKDQA
jgi:hypothetical protein